MSFAFNIPFKVEKHIPMVKTPWIKFDGASAIMLGLISPDIEVEMIAKYNRTGILFGSYTNSTYYTLGPYGSSYLASTVWGSGRRATVSSSYADGNKRSYVVNGNAGLSVDEMDFVPFSGSASNKSSIYFSIGARARSSTTVDNDNRIVYAPDTLGASLQAPKIWQYHAANYWELDKTMPTAPEGKYAKPVVIDGYKIGDLVTVQEEHIPAVNEETGEPLDPDDEYKSIVKVVRQRYEFVDIPEEAKPPRVFSKLYLRIALRKRGLEAAFDTLLDESGLRRMWEDANELSEAFPDFGDYLGEAQKAMNLTDEEVDEILGEAVAR